MLVSISTRTLDLLPVGDCKNVWHHFKVETHKFFSSNVFKMHHDEEKNV